MNRNLPTDLSVDAARHVVETRVLAVIPGTPVQRLVRLAVGVWELTAMDGNVYFHVSHAATFNPVIEGRLCPRDERRFIRILSGEDNLLVNLPAGVYAYLARFADYPSGE